MLVRTALALASKRADRADAIANRRAAKDWLNGKRGIVKFLDACVTLDVDPAKARQAILDYAAEASSCPIKRSRHRPHSHVVFGRMKYDNDRVRKDQDSS